MYKVIGADQKEYGPVSGEQIRQWIRDGRVNGLTQARSEAGGDWQPLSSFPEFADAFSPGSINPIGAPSPGMPPLSSGGGSREAALSALKGPAIALIIVASLGAAYYLLNGVYTLIAGAPMFQRQLPPNVTPEMRAFIQGMQGPLAGVVSFFIAALNGFVLFGAIKMLKLESRGLAMAASIVAMLPCSCCCILGLPFGIWAIVMLNKPEVKLQFSS
jgi:hypothetical protein